VSEELALREAVALACRVLAHQGLVRDIIGHVSARAPGGEGMLLRCRGEDEYGLAYTSAEQVRLLDFDGAGDGLGPNHVAPLEAPIHGEILRSRPEAGAVVHAHPEYALLCGLAGLELRPIFGAFDPYATGIAVAGVPVYPRPWLIDSPERARELTAAMTGHDACLLRGHGIVTVGATVEEAVIRAIKLETLARVTWQLHAAGVAPRDLAADELAAFGGVGGPIPGGERWLWRHYVRALDEQPAPWGAA